MSVIYAEIALVARTKQDIFFRGVKRASGFSRTHAENKKRNIPVSGGTGSQRALSYSIGRIQISKITPDGRELTLKICSKDDIVGELTLFTDHAKYLLNAKVLENGEVAVINKEDLEQKLFENPALAFEFMKWMSDHFRRTQLGS